jgi:hypothetical protein
MSSTTIGDTPSWRRATAWLALLGTFFYASYGFSNWLASQRSDVPIVVFDWERSVPFIAWTIVPYWSTNLSSCSLYLCRSRSELDIHAKRLLTAQIIAVACFIAFRYAPRSQSRPSTAFLDLSSKPSARSTCHSIRHRPCTSRSRRCSLRCTCGSCPAGSPLAS